MFYSRSKLIGSAIALGVVVSACGSTSAAKSAVSSTSSTTSASSKTTLSASALAAQAKALFPQGITLVSNLPPGGPNYSAGEALQPFLQSVLKVPVTVRPVLGGGGNTAAQFVYNSSPNSGILMMSYIPQLAVGELVGNGAYKLLNYTPLAGLFGNDTSIYVSKFGSPYKNFASLKASTKTITIGVFGVKTSAGWMSAQFLSKVNHIKTATVPFTNGAQSVDGVLSGAVDLASVTSAQALPLIAEKRVQPVVEFAPKQLSYLPGTESIAQVGSPNEAFYNLMGVDGPPKMSAESTQVLQQALSIIEKNPAYIAKAKKLSLTPVYENASAWKASQKSEFNLVKSHLSILKG